VGAGGGTAPEAEAEEDEGLKPLPERLVTELTASRTLALRDAVANNPHVAMTLLLHKLCLDAFQHGGSGHCLEASVCEVHFPVQPADLNDSPPAKAMNERHEAWRKDMPQDEAALWNWLAALDDAGRAALLAHCTALGINALYEKADTYGCVTAHGVQRRLAQADRLAHAVNLDMTAAGWAPTIDNYLGRVPKARILEAVREAKGDAAAQLIEHLKKPDMAREAERLLASAGWVPEPLRLADIALEPAPQGDAGGDDDERADLPDFLSEGLNDE
jgi:ParB family chromosome partitioning protein